GLGGVRLGAGVDVVSRARGPSVAALLRAVQEVRDLGRTVVLRNESRDGFGQVRVLGQGEPIRDVRLDDLRRLVRLEPVVRVVAARLVLHEVLRVLDLPDVVVAAPHTPRSAISPTLQLPMSPSARAPARYPSAMIRTGT